MGRKKNLCTLVWCAVFCTMAALNVYGQQSVRPRPLKFTDEEMKLPFPFRRSASNDPYLLKLRTEYKLDQVIAGKKNDYDKVRAICKWVRSRWEHNGSSIPEKWDPISILQEAETGKQFRCVEYSTVLSGALNAVGIPARSLTIMTEDADTRESGAAHVIAEAYLADRQKWIMVDGQFDVIPTLRGKPLSALELQQALAKGDRGVNVESFSNAKADKYFEFVGPYLFYFMTKLDGRFPAATRAEELFLMPVGAKKITIFQGKYPLNNAIFTTSRRVFYAKPV